MGPYFKDTRDIPKCFRKMARPFHSIDIDNVLCRRERGTMEGPGEIF